MLELKAAGIGLFAIGGFENFCSLHIEEAQAHGTMTHDAFEMAATTAAAVVLLVVKGDDGVAALPYSFSEGVYAVADAGANGPHANKAVELVMLGGESR